MLNHFSELSHSSCYSAQSFFTELQCSTILQNDTARHGHEGREAARSRTREAGGGSVEEARGRRVTRSWVLRAGGGSVGEARDWVVGAWDRPEHVGGRPWLDQLVGPLGPGDGPEVHHPR
jgi:hypothetical protein